MHARGLLERIFDFFEITLVWAMVWFCIAIVPLTFFLAAEPTIGKLWLVLPFVTIEFTLVGAALSDLYLRIKRKPSLISQLKNWWVSGTSPINGALEKLGEFADASTTVLVLAPLLLLAVVAIVAIVGLVLYWAFGAIAALPTSVAILIGALLVADAIRRRK